MIKHLRDKQKLITNFMKRLLSTTYLLMTLLATVSAQYFIIDTTRLSKAYNDLLQNPQSGLKQREFFNAFPGSWQEYYDTYKYCDKEGYDLSMYSRAFEHIKALENCTTINDTLFCNKLIALSVGASLDADAPNYLQELLHHTMQQRNDVFIHCLSKIEKGHQMQFWQFYWSNIVDGQSQEKHFEVLYNINKEKYPCLMKIMSIAFEYFNNKVLFMEDFKNMMNSK